jgi:enoyl-CoA hydratase
MEIAASRLRRNLVDGVLTLAIDRPGALNAIDRATFADLAAALTEATRQAAVRVVVLRGSGENFSAGADIKEEIPAPAELHALAQAPHPVALLYACPKPTLAGICGYCLGGALEIALGFDLRLAADNALFGFAEIDWALTPGWGGAALLQRIVGRATALDLLLTGRRIGAAEALRLGLVSEVCPAVAFETRLAALAARLAEAPPRTVSAIKRLLADRDLAGDLERELALFAEIAHDPEAQRRINAFRSGKRL